MKSVRVCGVWRVCVCVCTCECLCMSDVYDVCVCVCVERWYGCAAERDGRERRRVLERTVLVCRCISEAAAKVWGKEGERVRKGGERRPTASVCVLCVCFVGCVCVCVCVLCVFVKRGRERDRRHEMGERGKEATAHTPGRPTTLRTVSAAKGQRKDSIRNLREGERWREEAN